MILPLPSTILGSSLVWSQYLVKSIHTLHMPMVISMLREYIVYIGAAPKGKSDMWLNGSSTSCFSWKLIEIINWSQYSFHAAQKFHALQYFPILLIMSHCFAVNALWLELGWAVHDCHRTPVLWAVTKMCRIETRFGNVNCLNSKTDFLYVIGNLNSKR
jgi:hypothetical protein